MTFGLMTTMAMEEVINKVRYEGYAFAQALRESPVDFTKEEIGQMAEELDLEED